MYHNEATTEFKKLNASIFSFIFPFQNSDLVVNKNINGKVKSEFVNKNEF